MNYGGSLKEARKSRGVSQNELARRTGIPQPYISRIESGRISPSLDYMDRLLGAIGYAITFKRIEEK